MKKSSFIIQLILVAALIVLISIYFQRSMILVTQGDAIALIILFILIPMIFIFGIGNSLSHFRTPFRKECSVSDKKAAIHFFKSMTTYLLLSSGAVTISVLCFMLGYLDDGSSLGPFLDTALNTPLYAILISVGIFLPLRFHLEKEIIVKGE